MGEVHPAAVGARFITAHGPQAASDLRSLKPLASHRGADFRRRPHSLDRSRSARGSGRAARPELRLRSMPRGRSHRGRPLHHQAPPNTPVPPRAEEISAPQVVPSAGAGCGCQLATTHADGARSLTHGEPAPGAHRSKELRPREARTSAERRGCAALLVRAELGSTGAPIASRSRPFTARHRAPFPVRRTGRC